MRPERTKDVVGGDWRGNAPVRLASGGFVASCSVGVERDNAGAMTGSLRGRATGEVLKSTLGRNFGKDVLEAEYVYNKDRKPIDKAKTTWRHRSKFFKPKSGASDNDVTLLV